MKFTVVWLPSIERRLTEIWLASDNRAAITTAVDTIDQRLRRDPHAAGLKFDDDVWQLLVGRVAVLYSISDADARVKVIDVDEMPDALE
jgi:mRNA-degrading endonuclease RelE of RelBE toxin-antitoxin system